ncbi:MAG: hypothetical protein GXO77_10910 [Calditrichaeota bacterium]|nr:hypothetical protein [Calditrichota bacterium]
MMVIRSFIVLIVLLQMAFGQTAKYAGSFLELGVGARALAMGGASVANSGDVTSAFWNPAGLAMVNRFQAGSMYADLFNKLEQQSYVGALIPLMKNAAISVSWVRLSVDEIPRYEFDEDNPVTAYQRLHGQAEQLTSQPVDFFSNQNDVFIFSFARSVPYKLDLGWQYFEVPIKFGFGVNVKYIRQQIDKNSGSGIGIDFGFLTGLNLSDIFNGPNYGMLTFGLNAQDLTETRIIWDTDTKHADYIHRNFKYGVAYSQPLPFIKSVFTFNYDVDSKYNGNTHLGGELFIRSLLALRIGLNAGHFTTGAGIAMWKFRVNYAYQSHDLGNSHRVSIILVF